MTQMNEGIVKGRTMVKLELLIQMATKDGLFSYDEVREIQRVMLCPHCPNREDCEVRRELFSGTRVVEFGAEVKYE
jgi:hypothetical protein